MGGLHEKASALPLKADILRGGSNYFECSPIIKSTTEWRRSYGAYRGL
jgi:hypothetical protein